MAADAQNLTYYYRLFGSLNIFRVEMKTQDLDAKDIETPLVQKGAIYQELKQSTRYR